MEEVWKHKYLEKRKYALSKKQATKWVDKLFKIHFIKMPEDKTIKCLRCVKTDNKKKRSTVVQEFSFNDIVEITRKKGFPEPIFSALKGKYNNDKYFPALPDGEGWYYKNKLTFYYIDLKTNQQIWLESDKENHRDVILQNAVNWEHTTLSAPFRYFNVFDEYSSDILRFRRLACTYSHGNNFDKLTSYYRAYLNSCISLINAFTCRHLMVIENIKSHKKFMEIFGNKPLEQSLKEAFESCTKKNLSVLTKSKEWDHFLKIKQKRNCIVHPYLPYFDHEIKVISRHLNYVNFGIGGLMRKFRNSYNLRTLPFIERLKNANKVIFKDHPNN